jgi:hypothetical protein
METCLILIRPGHTYSLEIDYGGIFVGKPSLPGNCDRRQRFLENAAGSPGFLADEIIEICPAPHERLEFRGFWGQAAISGDIPSPLNANLNVAANSQTAPLKIRL